MADNFSVYVYRKCTNCTAEFALAYLTTEAKIDACVAWMEEKMGSEVLCKKCKLGNPQAPEGL